MISDGFWFDVIVKILFCSFVCIYIYMIPDGFWFDVIVYFLYWSLGEGIQNTQRVWVNSYSTTNSVHHMLQHHCYLYTTFQ